MGPVGHEIRTNAAGELYMQDSAGRAVRLYRFREALALAGTTAMTYYAWVKCGAIRDARVRDQGKWRVFTEAEVQELVRVAGMYHTAAAEQQPASASGPRHAYHWREAR